MIKICSILHLQTAVYQAILAQAQRSLRTKTVHSEILWALNPTNNVYIFFFLQIRRSSIISSVPQISEAIRRYGLADNTSSLIVVRITSPDLGSVKELMSSVVSGTLSPLEELSNITDWASVKKACVCSV